MGEGAGVTQSVERTGADRGGPAGFDAFFGRERTSLVRAVAFATGDAGSAAESVDEAMARAFQRWDRVGRYTDPAGWVYRVAVNVGRSRWRRARRLVLGATGDGGSTPSEPTVPDADLWHAVAALPGGQRDAVVLRFVLDWDFSRIGHALGIEESSARARVSRGLSTLRRTLEAQP